MLQELDAMNLFSYSILARATVILCRKYTDRTIPNEAIIVRIAIATRRAVHIRHHAARLRDFANVSKATASTIMTPIMTC